MQNNHPANEVSEPVVSITFPLGLRHWICMKNHDEIPPTSIQSPFLLIKPPYTHNSDVSVVPDILPCELLIVDYIQWHPIISFLYSNNTHKHWLLPYYIPLEPPSYSIEIYKIPIFIGYIQKWWLNILNSPWFLPQPDPVPAPTGPSQRSGFAWGRSPDVQPCRNQRLRPGRGSRKGFFWWVWPTKTVDLMVI